MFQSCDKKTLYRHEARLLLLMMKKNRDIYGAIGKIVKLISNGDDKNSWC